MTNCMSMPSNTETVTLSLASATHGRPATIQKADASEFRQITELSVSAIQKAALFNSFRNISELTGGHVEVLPDFGYMPTLIDTEGNPIFLYRIIEGLDEHLDEEKLLEDFPTLTYSQISSAIWFLKRVSQLNIQELDVDAYEDAYMLSNSGFLVELEQAHNAKEVIRVLGQPE